MRELEDGIEKEKSLLYSRHTNSHKLMRTHMRELSETLVFHGPLHVKHFSWAIVNTNGTRPAIVLLDFRSINFCDAAAKNKHSTATHNDI